MSKTTTSPGRFWVIRKPESGGTTVMKYETTADDPSSISIEIPESCIAYSVATRRRLENETIDTSVLTDEEKNILDVA